MKPGLDRWQPGQHNGTFRANNLALVAATAALRHWETPTFAADIQRKGRLLADGLSALVARHPGLDLVTRGVGLATEADFLAMCDRLRRETILGFDVETTMYTRILCLMQIACADAVYLVDALAVTDLAPIAPILSDPGIIKVIHNATFERTTLKRYDLELDGVVDTLVVSRQLRGKKVGRHNLKEVCARELGVELDKADQTSDWTRRPLSPSQRAYAALDAEILLHLHAHFGSPRPDSLHTQARLPGT